MRKWTVFFSLFFFTFLDGVSTAPLEKKHPKSSGLIKDELSDLIEDNNNQFSDKNKSSQFSTQETKETVERSLNVPIDKHKVDVLSKVSNVNDVRHNRKKETMNILKPKQFNKKKTKVDELKYNEDNENEDETKSLGGNNVDNTSTLDSIDLSNSNSIEDDQMFMSDESMTDNMDTDSIEDDSIDNLLNGLKLDTTPPIWKVTKENEKKTKHNNAPKLQKASGRKLSQPSKTYTKSIKPNTEHSSDVPNNNMTKSNNNILENISQFDELSKEQLNKNSDMNKKAQDIISIFSPPTKIIPYQSDGELTPPMYNDNHFIDENGKITLPSSSKLSKQSKTPNFHSIITQNPKLNNNETNNDKILNSSNPIIQKQNPGNFEKQGDSKINEPTPPDQKFKPAVNEIDELSSDKIIPQTVNNLNKHGSTRKPKQITNISENSVSEDKYTDLLLEDQNEEETNESDGSTQSKLDETQKPSSFHRPIPKRPYNTKTLSDEKFKEPQTSTTINDSPMIKNEDLIDDKENELPGNRHNRSLPENENEERPGAPNPNNSPLSKSKKMPKKGKFRKPNIKTSDKFVSENGNETAKPFSSDDRENDLNIEKEYLIVDKENELPRNQHNKSMPANENEERTGVKNINSSPQSESETLPKAGSFHRSIPKTSDKNLPRNINIIVEPLPLDNNNKSPNIVDEDLIEVTKNELPGNQQNKSLPANENEERPGASKLNSSPQSKSEKMTKKGTFRKPKTKTSNNFLPENINEMAKPLSSDDSENDLNTEKEDLIDDKENELPGNPLDRSLPANENEERPGASNLNSSPQSKSEKMTKKGPFRKPKTKTSNNFLPENINEMAKPLSSDDSENDLNTEKEDLIDDKENELPGNPLDRSLPANENEERLGASNLNSSPQSKSEKMTKKGTFRKPKTKTSNNFLPENINEMAKPLSSDDSENDLNTEKEDLIDDKENELPGNPLDRSLPANENEERHGASNLNSSPQSKSEKMTKKGPFRKPKTKTSNNFLPENINEMAKPLSSDDSENDLNTEKEDLIDDKENELPGNPLDRSLPANENEERPGASNLNSSPQSKSEKMTKKGTFRKPKTKTSNNFLPENINEMAKPLSSDDSENDLNTEKEDLIDDKENELPGNPLDRSLPANENEERPGASNLNSSPQSKSEKMTKKGTFRKPKTKISNNFLPENINEIAKPLSSDDSENDLNTEKEDLIDDKENELPGNPLDRSLSANENEERPGASNLNSSPQSKSEKMTKKGTFRKPKTKTSNNFLPENINEMAKPLSSDDSENDLNTEKEDLIDDKENELPGNPLDRSLPANENEERPGASNLNSSPQSKSEKMTKKGTFRKPKTKTSNNFLPENINEMAKPLSSDDSENDLNTEKEDLIDDKENELPGNPLDRSLPANENEERPGASNLNSSPQSKSEKMTKKGTFRKPKTKTSNNFLPENINEMAKPLSSDDSENDLNTEKEDLIDDKENELPGNPLDRSLPANENEERPGASNLNSSPQSKSEKMTKKGTFRKPKTKISNNFLPENINEMAKPLSSDDSENDLNTEKEDLIDDKENELPGNPLDRSLSANENEERPGASNLNSSPQSKSEKMTKKGTFRKPKTKTSNNFLPENINEMAKPLSSDDSENDLNTEKEDLIDDKENELPGNPLDRYLPANENEERPGASNLNSSPQSKSEKMTKKGTFRKPKTKTSNNFLPENINEMAKPLSSDDSENDLNTEKEDLIDDKENELPGNPLDRSLPANENEERPGASNLNSSPQSKSEKMTKKGTFRKPKTKTSNNFLPENINEMAKPLSSDDSENDLNTEKEDLIDDKENELPGNPLDRSLPANENEERPGASNLNSSPQSKSGKIPKNEIFQKPNDKNENEMTGSFSLDNKNDSSFILDNYVPANVFGNIPMLDSNKEDSSDILGTDEKDHIENFPLKISESNPDKSNLPTIDSSDSDLEGLNNNDEKSTNPEEDVVNNPTPLDLNNVVADKTFSSEGKPDAPESNHIDTPSNVFENIPMLDSNKKDSSDILGTAETDQIENFPLEINESNPDKSNLATIDSSDSDLEGLYNNDEKSTNPEENVVNNPNPPDLNNVETDKTLSSEGKTDKPESNHIDTPSNVFENIPMLDSNKEDSSDILGTVETDQIENFPLEINESNPDKSNLATIDSSDSDLEGLNNNDEKSTNLEENVVNNPTPPDLNNVETDKTLSSEGKTDKPESNHIDTPSNVFENIPMLDSNKEDSSDILGTAETDQIENFPLEINESNPDKSNLATIDSSDSDLEGLNNNDEKSTNPEENVVNNPTPPDLNNVEADETLSSEGKTDKPESNHIDTPSNVFENIPMLDSNKEDSSDILGTAETDQIENFPLEINESNPDKSNLATIDSSDFDLEGLNNNDEKSTNPEEDVVNNPTLPDLNNVEADKTFSSEGKPDATESSHTDTPSNVFENIPMLDSNKKDSSDILGTAETDQIENFPLEINESNPDKSNLATIDSSDSDLEGLNNNDEKSTNPEEDVVNNPTPPDLNNVEADKTFSSEGKPDAIESSHTDTPSNVLENIPILDSNKEDSSDILGTDEKDQIENFPLEISESNPDKSNLPTIDSSDSDLEGLNNNDEKSTNPEEDVVNNPTPPDLNNVEADKTFISEGKPDAPESSHIDALPNVFENIPMLDSNKEDSSDILGTDEKDQIENFPLETSESNPDKSNLPTIDSSDSDLEGLNNNDEKSTNPEEDVVNNPTPPDLNNVEADETFSSEGNPDAPESNHIDTPSNVFENIPMLDSNNEGSSDILDTDGTDQIENFPLEISESNPDKSNLLTIDSSDSDLEGLNNNDEKSTNPQEDVVNNPTPPDLNNVEADKSFSSKGKSDAPESSYIDDFGNVFGNIPMLDSNKEDLNSSTPLNKNEYTKDNPMFSNLKFGSPIFSTSSNQGIKKPNKSKTFLNSSSLNNPGHILILNSDKKNSDEIGNNDGLKLPTVIKGDHSYVPFEKTVTTYSGGNQINQHKEKNPNELKNSPSNIIDKSSPGPNILSGDVKFHIPYTEPSAIPKNKSDMSETLFLSPKIDSNKFENGYKEITTPNNDMAEISYPKNDEMVTPNSFISYFKNILQDHQNNKPVDPGHDFHLTKPNLFLSPVFSENKEFNRFGCMKPKFSNNYEGGNSNCDLWETLPPKQKTNPNMNEKFSSFNNALEMNNPITGGYHNNVVSNNVNIDKNLNTKNNDENSNDNKSNIKNEINDDIIKNLTDKVLGRIDDIDDKISKLEKINNGNNIINHKDNVKVDDFKTHDSSRSRKHTSKKKKKVYSISQDSSGNQSSDDTEMFSSNKSDESNDIINPKIKNKSIRSKKYKNSETNKNNNFKNKKIKEGEDHKKRKKNNHDDTVLIQNKGKKRKLKKSKEITSASENSREVDDITNIESLNESYEVKEDLKNKHGKKKTPTKKKTKRKSSKIKSKQIKRSKKGPVENNSGDEQIIINENNYDVKENYERNINNDVKKTKQSKIGKNRKNKNIVIKKKTENNIIQTENGTENSKNDSTTDASDGYQLVTFYPQYAYTNPFSRIFSRTRPVYRNLF